MIDSHLVLKTIVTDRSVPPVIDSARTTTPPSEHHCTDSASNSARWLSVGWWQTPQGRVSKPEHVNMKQYVRYCVSYLVLFIVIVVSNLYQPIL